MPRNLETIKNELNSNIENKETTKFTENIVNLVNQTEADILAKFEELKNVSDEQILASRGVYSLTNEEKTFYNSLVTNARNGNGVSNIDLTLPTTTIDRIFEDIKKERPLLSKTDFINSKGITEWLMTSEYSQLYSWGDLHDAITSENNATVIKVTFANFKLSAWMPISLTALELGLTWLDLYIRTILAQAIAKGLENAIINGNGQKQPVGMIKEINVANQTVPAQDKNAVAITELNVATLGGIAKELTNDGKRNVQGMAMLVNPVDYLEKVLPAITVMNFAGAYTQHLPFPVDIIESTEVPQGKAIFGLLKNYFATIGLSKDAKITYSDDYKFLDDVRTYKAKIVAYGTPKDNASFVVKDITGLKPAYITTKTAK